MKLLPVLLFNVATVALALVAYDALRSEPEVPPTEVDTSAIEARLAALEASRPRSRRSAGADPSVLERLAALESMLPMPAEADDVPQAAFDESDDTGTAGLEGPEISAPIGEISAGEIQHFRRLQAAVRREDTIEKNRPRLDKTLDALPINLTPRQREKVHAAYADFQPRVNQIWTEVKTEAQATIAAGGEVDRGEIVSSTMTIIQDEFADTLIGVVGAADAQAIAGALHPGRK